MKSGKALHGKHRADPSSLPASRAIIRPPSIAVVRLSLVALIFITQTGCSGGPALSSEDRKRDVEFLAEWARKYSPFVELNETLRGLPNYEAVAPRYARMASEAHSDAEFYQIVFGYFSLLGVSGHGHLLSAASLRAFRREALRRPGQLTAEQLEAACYWPRIEERACFVHPPFPVVREGERYRTARDWRFHGRLIPKGSKIIGVNGKDCTAYLKWVRSETWVRYILRDTSWLDESLLAAHEGPDFRGWQVSFLLPDQTTCEALVPWRKGAPPPVPFSDYGAAEGNCVCLELNEEVGYLRIKCMGSMFLEKDGRKIRDFLEDSRGKYRKLIIDVRRNEGGSPYYAFENLISPFLDEAVTYAEIGGIRRPFLTDYEPAFLERLRGGVSVFAHETRVEEIKPPEGWDEARWVFYQIQRQVNPRPRYNFVGQLFILLDGATGSAADTYVNTAQRLQMATLVGRPTAGSCGPYFLPVMVRLPRSGMVFLLEADLMLNRDGTINEIAGTKPDLECPPAPVPEKVTKEELLRDKWVKKIMVEL